jgi:16S rRNA (uracil1498-N3)-methyltransferase
VTGQGHPGRPGTELQQLRDRPLVFVDDLSAPQLDEHDHHHLARSLRVRSGTTITAADGAGRWRPVSFGDQLEVEGEIEAVDRAMPLATVGFAPVKGDRSELVVQKLTELGTDVIVPIVAERSVVRWDDARSVKNLARHRRIAREAAMQSRNLWLPTIERLTPLDQFLASRPEAVLADPAGAPLASHRFGGDEAAVAIGPEGGFSPSELDGRVTASLPGRILRTETAAIAAAVILAGSGL